MPGLHHNKKRRNSSKAVRILTEPFPVPPICNATVDLPATGKIGIRFRWNGKPGDRVKIVAIETGSPILAAAAAASGAGAGLDGGGTSASSSSSSTRIQPGHTVLAVNGVPALKSSQVGHLIRSSGRTVTLTTCQGGPMEDAPFCKVLTAPGGKRHPGINIDSTRDRCLVKITRVFPNGPFSGSDLREGDILLAVNGVAVSKPEEAERRLQDASIHSPFVHLYVLDIHSYRQSIVDEIQASSRLYEGLTLTDNLDGSSRNHYLLQHCGGGAGAAFPVQFNPETQRLVDHPALVPPAARGFQSKRSYLDLIRPFIKAYNDGMEERMRLLEEAVSCEAWRISCDAAERRGRQRLGSGLSSADRGAAGCSSDDEVSLSWSGGSESSPTPSPSFFTSPSVELDTVQVAAAELIVLPVEALQTLDERNNHQILLTSM